MLYIVISILFFCIQNATNKAFGNHFRASTRLLLMYQLPVHLTMIVCLVSVGTTLSLPLDGWLLAALYGVCFLTAITMLTKAMSIGPIGETALISNLSLLLSVVASVLFFGEEMTKWRWLGIPCILLTLVLSALGGGDDKQKSKRWLLLALLTMLFDGGLSIVQKTFIAAHPEIEVSTFILASVLVGTAICVVLTAYSIGTRKLEMPGQMPRFCLYAVLVGVGTVFGTLFNMWALTELDGLVVFPIRQGGLIVLMTVYGIVRYRDRFNARVAAMMLSGLLGIVLLNL